MLINLTVLFSLVYLMNLTKAQRSNSKCCEDYCFGTDDERKQIRHFSTNTAYQVVKGAQSDRQYNVPGCTPVRFWLLSRHGTTLPTGSSIKKLRTISDLRDEIINNYRRSNTKPDRGALCEEDLELLELWQWDRNVTDSYDEFLTTQGWEDLKFLARNYQRIFPNVLQNIYDQGNFLFRHTNTQRTEASYKAFVEGLFGDKAYDQIRLPTTPEKDYLLRPYEFCDAWKKQSDAAVGPDSEFSKFIASDLYKNISADISTRLGFRYTLPADQIDQIWDMCRFEQAWYLGRPSPWCAAFTASQVDVLEYKEDLMFYYKSGHGSELNKRLACATVNDMLTQLEYNVGPKTVAYFTHSSELQLFLVALGAVKDNEPLRADNYDRLRNRFWRTSAIAPFAANVAAIKYECPNQKEQHKIMFFLNEKPLEFEWCNVGLCNWSDVKEKYKSFKDADCTKDFCGGSSAHKIDVSGLILMLTVLFGFIKSNWV